MIFVIVRIFIRIFAWFDLLLFTILAYLLSWLPQSWLKSFYHPIFRFWCQIFVRALGVDLELQEKNVKPLPKQYILIANHPSAFEDVGIPALFNVKSVAKHEVASWFIVGRISTASGSIYVKRDEPESRHLATDAIKKALHEGHSIVIYPEGGCKGRRLYKTFQYGAFDISMQTGIPIVPVFLHYEAQEDFEWSNQYLVTKFWQFMTAKDNRATYYVFDALNPHEFKSKEEYMEHTYQQYLAWQKKYLE